MEERGRFRNFQVFVVDATDTPWNEIMMVGTFENGTTCMDQLTEADLIGDDLVGLLSRLDVRMHQLNYNVHHYIIVSPEFADRLSASLNGMTSTKTTEEYRRMAKEKMS